MSYFTVTEQNVKVWQTAVEADNQGKAPGTILSADKQGILVATGNGALRLISLQPPGKKAMSAADLLNSRREWFEPGTQL